MGHCVAILTVSDGVASGTREDLSGKAIDVLLRGSALEAIATDVVPDDSERIQAKLCEWADVNDVDIIFTTGGTGMSTRDVTPEATLAVCDRVVPGMAEVMRQRSLEKTPFAMLSRAVVGIRGTTIIINLPGSPKGVTENLEVVLPVLEHAIATLHGSTHEIG